MSTQTEHRADSIEHLDHEAECDMKWHQGPPKAHFWIDAHNCHDALTCSSCLVKAKDDFRGLILLGGAVSCSICGRHFVSFERFARVVPL
ncbi:hypothetical protein IU451_28970 [Nocardia cyriacigeorgica]|uniref:hypothetical protein n=1 Tax=Nocardia cyriacigeorgica TaxID=135487 RepID=UPI0018941DC8|nr:hypothetical protein [Nocardia cyriacigeorgica]MBF6326536.1 hypothetical protein [Nocardia cyriacigeorgica]